MSDLLKIAKKYEMRVKLAQEVKPVGVREVLLSAKAAVDASDQMISKLQPEFEKCVKDFQGKTVDIYIQSDPKGGDQGVGGISIVAQPNLQVDSLSKFLQFANTFSSKIEKAGSSFGPLYGKSIFSVGLLRFRDGKVSQIS